MKRVTTDQGDLMEMVAKDVGWRGWPRSVERGYPMRLDEGVEQGE